MKKYEAISALAGAGKTYQLTNRFIGLLSSGAAPESILAITFTRKAAGEIFDRVITRLAQAILDSYERERLQKDLQKLRGEPDYQLRPSDLQDWLQRLVRVMPRLRIGTIDSLFVHMVQAFAFELGLPTRIEILDGMLLKEAQGHALDHALLSMQRDPTVPTWLDEVFRQIMQVERKAVRSVLLDLVASCHVLYLQTSDASLWGNPDFIWRGKAWWEKTRATCAPENLKSTILDQTPTDGENNLYKDAWNKVLDYLVSGHYEAKISSTLLEYLAKHWEHLGRQDLLFSYRRKRYLISAAVGKMLRELAALPFRRHVDKLCDAARGCHRLLAAYERIYDQQVRGAGRLSFHDVQFILQRAAEKEVKLNIDYRLDGTFYHWLLDEFQDTSRQQWSILENVIDEVLQNDSQNRSFFYVGDPKQAIYAWRGGDSTLFDEVREKYRYLFDEKPTVLDICWRSSPVIVDAVNKLFDPDHLERLVPAFSAEVQRWRRNWTPHQASRPNKDLPGYVEVRVVAEDESSEGSEDEPLEKSRSIIRATCEVVKKLRKAGIGSIAVLVRLNRFGDEVAEALRHEGIPVLREMNSKLCDNGVVAALLSMLQFADHPGNDFYFQHLRYSGLIQILAQVFDMPTAQWEHRTARRHLAMRLSEQVAQVGIAGLLAKVMRTAFETTGGRADDEFIDIRLRQLMLAAIEYDRGGRGSPFDFAELAWQMEVKDPVVTEGVVVMTVHKAKGLEFDAVILPDLKGQRRGMTDVWEGSLWVFDISAEEAKQADLSAGWILPLPNQTVTQLDPVLRRFREHAQRKRFYEELCLLYVATTRAKQATYFIIPATSSHRGKKEIQQAEGSKSTLERPYPADLVSHTFCQGKIAETDNDSSSGTAMFRLGDESWFDKPRPKSTRPLSVAGASAFRPSPLKHTELSKRLLAGTPSGTEVAVPLSAEALFDLAARRGAQRGTLLHEMFQRITWFMPSTGQHIAQKFREKAVFFEPDVLESALDEFLGALSVKEIQDCLKRPSEFAEVWNEQTFELAEGDQWITGRIDRVVVERDQNNTVVSATVIDFKTDRVATDEELHARVAYYREQMRWYAKAVAKLVGIAPTKVRTLLLFTHPRKVVLVE